ncbi:glycosyltransferase family 4 protein [Christiangramia sediminis]|uniref:Glycosyltransferase family 4 protein n=1 Tax=Christiangramia sediminis TaxID=2881336 RepID=A0A9X1LJ59_9FLAO|nr:glycosyltransferase family 4 protein [Christiangramia sediminis]MCB7481318.1 glycosyltransferase family 4 protein [Christiangramia sediminis]
MSSEQHIAVVCNYELKPDRIGGMDRFFRAYDKELKRKGCYVKWFFAGNNHPDFHSDLDVSLAGTEALESFFTKHLHLKKDYSVVVTHFIALCTPFFKKIKERTPAYIIAVDHNPRPLEGFSQKKRLKNKVRGMLYASYIDHFAGVSQYTADAIIKDYGKALMKKTSVVYNGIDFKCYKKREQINHGRFIVASHLRKSKGISDLIMAVGRLPDGIKEKMKIDVYGEGPLENELKEQVVFNNLNGIIELRGSTSRLPELFQNYSFLIQPTYMECFSLSILESLASNVPVITTPVGGNLEIINDNMNGYIFEPKNTEQLIVILQDIMTGKKEISQPVHNLIEKRFNLEEMLSNHLKLLPCI